jgi:hypothetical protein
MSQPAADLNVGYLPPQLTRDDAIRVLTRSRFRILRRFLFRRSAAPVMASRVHLVWMPHYLIDLQIKSSKGTAIQQVTLDTYGGVFALWNIDAPPSTGLPEGEIFPPRMDVQAGVGKAIVALTNTTLHMRGQKSKPHVIGHSTIQLLYYPFWVYYFERRQGLLDMKIVDGAMGERPGNQVKRAILEAFIESSPGPTARRP